MNLTDPTQQAISSLIEDSDPSYIRNAIDMLLQINQLFPVCFAGSLEFLNPLLDIALRDPPRFNEIKVLIDTKRFAQHKPMMFPSERAKLSQSSILREIKSGRRGRLQLAVRIENFIRGAAGGEKLASAARNQFEEKLANEWALELAEVENLARDKDGKLSQEKTRNIRKKFWSDLDIDQQKKWQDLINPIIADK
jgi:hypothetical protein